ncbi:MAG: FecR domain-containing protein [Verrucomicrobiota bacterium]
MSSAVQSVIPDREIDRLAEALRGERLTEEDEQKLRKIVRQHPRARRRLVEQMYLGAALREGRRRWEHVLKPKASVIEWARVWPMVGGLAAAACLAFAVGIIVWGVGDGDPDLFSESESDSGEIFSGSDLLAESQAVAVITRTNRAKWGASQAPFIGGLSVGGLPVARGVIDLEEGIAQIDFYSGATVTLEGPARLEVVSPDLARLAYGNLWAFVPPPARGFRIETENFEVLDLGTEFGMTLRVDGQGEVHVIDGEVEVLGSQSNPIEKEHLLTTGEGLRVGADGRPESIAAVPSQFPATSRLDELARERNQVWKDFSYQLARQEDVLLFYDFAENRDWQRMLLNRAHFGPDSSDGAIVGCRWATGRWAEKQALEFRNSSHRVRVEVPGQFSDLTMLTWVRVDEPSIHSMSLLHPETSQDQFVHWTLLNPSPDLLLLHFAETTHNSITERPESDRVHYHNSVSLLRPGGSNYGEWMHLAVVYDSERQEVIHFHNGRVLGTCPIQDVRPIAIGLADLGNWPYREWAEGTKFEVRNLKGAMDEFVISKKAWTEREVRAHWMAGRP